MCMQADILHVIQTDKLSCMLVLCLLDGEICSDTQSYYFNVHLIANEPICHFYESRFMAHQVNHDLNALLNMSEWWLIITLLLLDIRELITGQTYVF